MMICVDQIYIKFSKKIFGKIPFVGPHLVRKVANLKTCIALKKIYLMFFAKVFLKTLA